MLGLAVATIAFAPLATSVADHGRSAKHSGKSCKSSQAFKLFYDTEILGFVIGERDRGHLKVRIKSYERSPQDFGNYITITWSGTKATRRKDATVACKVAIGSTKGIRWSSTAPSGSKTLDFPDGHGISYAFLKTRLKRK